MRIAIVGLVAAALLTTGLGRDLVRPAPAASGGLTAANHY